MAPGVATHVLLGIRVVVLRPDFEEFLDMMTARISDRNTKDDLKRVFNLFDDDRSGEIKVHHLKRVARELGEEISEEELKEIVQRADLESLM